MASVIQKLNCKFLFNLNLKLSLWLVAIKLDNTALDGLYYKSSWGRSLPSPVNTNEKVQDLVYRIFSGPSPGRLAGALCGPSPSSEEGTGVA